MMKKLLPLKELEKKIKSLKAGGKKIVFTNGCFDIIHGGHVKCLEKAKSLGDILVVALNTDQSVKKLKGKNRPLFPLKERARVLGAFADVDFITCFNEATPIKVIKALKPDILIKGSDYKDKEIVGGQFIKSYGGKVVRFPIYRNYSTSKILEEILKNF